MLLNVVACVSVSGGEIHDAVSAGNVEKVRTLLAADPGLANEKTDKRERPLGLAAVSGNKEIIELLLKAHADKNDGLDIAAEIGNKEVVELLLNSGAELNPTNRPSALLFAVGYGGRPAIVKLLLDRGASAKSKSKSGQTLLHTLVNAAVTSPKERSYAGKSWTVTPEDHEEIARLLLAHGADPRARNERGETPISLAQARGLTKMLAILKGG